MNTKKRKPYKKHTPKPKPINVYRLPPTNLLHEDVGFVVGCPICGGDHPQWPIKGLTGKPIKLANDCKVWDCRPKAAYQFKTLEYKFAGSIPAKFRLRYLGSEVAVTDTAMTYAEFKRARAANRKALKRHRRIERESRVAKSKTQSESKRSSPPH